MEEADGPGAGRCVAEDVCVQRSLSTACLQGGHGPSAACPSHAPTKRDEFPSALCKCIIAKNTTIYTYSSMSSAKLQLLQWISCLEMNIEQLAGTAPNGLNLK